jgi:succinate dehydrogenase / fumarate reductase iron-sulfur subunit
MTSKFILKILRGEPGEQYWEEFELERKPGANVISSLMDIQRNPINRKGEQVTPVVWESGCLEEVCGSCSMIINSKPRQACTALIDNLLAETQSDVVTLAPFTKFPLVRDLIVDRSSMFENLKRISAWVETDASHDPGQTLRISPDKQEIMYQLSQCMTCGCCLEGCPQVNSRSNFMGPALIGQVRLFNLHPVAGLQKAKRLQEMMGEGGVSGCGNAQNCVRVCPKNIPLTDAIAAIGRDTTLQAIKDLFSLPERE